MQQNHHAKDTHESGRIGKRLELGRVAINAGHRRSVPTSSAGADGESHGGERGSKRRTKAAEMIGGGNDGR